MNKMKLIQVKFGTRGDAEFKGWVNVPGNTWWQCINFLKAKELETISLAYYREVIDTGARDSAFQLMEYYAEFSAIEEKRDEWVLFCHSEEESTTWLSEKWLKDNIDPSLSTMCEFTDQQQQLIIDKAAIL